MFGSESRKLGIGEAVVMCDVGGGKKSNGELQMV